MEDKQIGVRLAATRGMVTINNKEQDETFKLKAVEKIIASLFEWSGEDARRTGALLRTFDTEVSVEKTLERLESAAGSLQRGVAIEILEELLKPQPHDQNPSLQAA